MDEDEDEDDDEEEDADEDEGDDDEDDDDEETSSLLTELSLTDSKDDLLTKAAMLSPFVWTPRSKSSPSSSSSSTCNNGKKKLFGRKHCNQLGLLQQYFGGYLERKWIGTDGQREGVSTTSNDWSPIDLNFLFIIVVLISPIPYITTNSNTNVVLSAGVPDMSVVAIETIPMSVVAVPVSISYAVVDEGSVFIFTELADKLRLQSCNSITKHESIFKYTQQSKDSFDLIQEGATPSTCHLVEC